MSVLLSFKTSRLIVDDISKAIDSITITITLVGIGFSDIIFIGYQCKFHILQHLGMGIELCNFEIRN